MYSLEAREVINLHSNVLSPAAVILKISFTNTAHFFYQHILFVMSICFWTMWCFCYCCLFACSFFFFFPLVAFLVIFVAFLLLQDEGSTILYKIYIFYSICSIKFSILFNLFFVAFLVTRWNKILSWPARDNPFSTIISSLKFSPKRIQKSFILTQR